eukprot:m.207822 g.207822  ORF g.207822 m.207822 type:complete len:64 (+) comp15032_c0_seq1:113-304(+)
MVFSTRLTAYLTSNGAVLLRLLAIVAFQLANNAKRCQVNFNMYSSVANQTSLTNTASLHASCD